MNLRSRRPLLLLFVISLALGLTGCGQETSDAAAPSSAAPLSPVDSAINEYENVSNECVRVSKKLRDGDLSITIKVIDLRDRTRALAAKLQQDAPKMTPPQAQRVAAISARVAPFLQE